MKKFDVMVGWANGEVSHPQIECDNAEALLRKIEELVKSVATGTAVELQIKEIQDGPPTGFRGLGY